MELVKSPVYTHCHFEAVQASVFSYLVHHSSHACATELGRTPGNHGAHLLHNDAVITRALQSEVTQDGPDLQQGQAVTAGERDNDQVCPGRPSGPPGSILEGSIGDGGNRAMNK